MKLVNGFSGPFSSGWSSRVGSYKLPAEKAMVRIGSLSRIHRPSFLSNTDQSVGIRRVSQSSRYSPVTVAKPSAGMSLGQMAWSSGPNPASCSQWDELFGRQQCSLVEARLWYQRLVTLGYRKPKPHFVRLVTVTPPQSQNPCEYRVNGRAL